MHLSGLQTLMPIFLASSLSLVFCSMVTVFLDEELLLLLLLDCEEEEELEDELEEEEELEEDEVFTTFEELELLLDLLASSRFHRKSFKG